MSSYTKLDQIITNNKTTSERSLSEKHWRKQLSACRISCWIGLSTLQPPPIYQLIAEFQEAPGTCTPHVKLDNIYWICQPAFWESWANKLKINVELDGLVFNFFNILSLSTDLTTYSLLNHLSHRFEIRFWQQCNQFQPKPQGSNTIFVAKVHCLYINYINWFTFLATQGFFVTCCSTLNIWTFSDVLILINSKFWSYLFFYLHLLCQEKEYGFNRKSIKLLNMINNMFVFQGTLMKYVLYLSLILCQTNQSDILCHKK